MTNEVAGALSFDAATTAASGLVAALIAAAVSWFVCHISLRAQHRNSLDSMIDKLVLIAIEYPYLEDDDYCTSWPNADHTGEAAMRYENYCCLVFNLLERLWKFHKGNQKRIEQDFFAREMIQRHKGWWKHDRNNLGGYDLVFHKYVNAVIRGE